MQSLSSKFKIFINFALLIAIFCLALSTFHLRPVFGLNMDSSNFRIQGGNINIGGGNESSESYNLSTTIGQLAAQEFQANGFVVKAGFQYLHSIIPFQFSLSNTNLKIGGLTPLSPQTATTTLTVSFGGAGGYQVTVAQDHELQTQVGATIPDTKCDSLCTELLAKPWRSKNVFGFGYNMSGEDIPPDFIDSNYFRPFPNRSKGELASVVMNNINVVKNHKGAMTVKANVAPDQPTGSYQTVINFVATPSF